MERPIDLARRFLELADRDIKAFQKLVPDRDIDDAVIGFHSQQAVEKCLKAVLARHEVALRKVHDLRALLDLLADNRLPAPPMRDEIVELNPFAVILVSILFGALILAGREIQPSGLPLLLQGIILFMVISSDVLLRYKIRLVRQEVGSKG